MTPAAIFLHVWCGSGGQWRSILDELFASLDEAQIPAPLHVGLVGVHAEEGATRMVDRGANVVATESTGWEHVTLEHVHSFCQWKPEADQAVLYIHTKGAHDSREVSNAWRRSMAYHLVTGWRDCLAAFDDPAVDAVGCHYMADHGGGPASHFAGNFWWARSSFVASLPPLNYWDRYQAEFWIGHSPEPRTIADMCPGGVGLGHDSGPCDHGREMIHDGHTAAVA